MEVCLTRRSARVTVLLPLTTAEWNAKSAAFGARMEGLPTEKTAPVAVRLAMEGSIVKSASRHVRMEGSLTQTSASATAQL
jgi:hypothetical protein